MNKCKKYDIPQLIDPRLQKVEYKNPMEVVLFEDKDGNPYCVKDVINENKKLQKQLNKLSKAIVNVNDSLNSFKKEHNNLVSSHKKQIKVLKAQIIELQEERK